MNDPRGSMWRRWDLHFHTPKSHDYQNKGITATQAVNALIKEKVDVVAVTDHHVIDVTFIREMQKAGNGKLTVLPGIELSSNLGGDEGVHFIAIFDENADLEHISSEIMAKLDLAKKRKDGIEEKRLYVEFPNFAKVIQDLGGIITIHGHGKAANYETISSRLKFKQQQKTDLIREYVDIIEVGSIEDATTYREKIFAAIDFELPIIACSDNHNATKYGTRTTCWIKADPTFDGLKMAIREPSSRFCLGGTPAAMERLAKNKTRYMKSVAFKKLPSMPTGEEWLQDVIPLNPGLVAIIGNKGSGKSALADCLGMLGSCTTSQSFSFLSDERFKHPKNGRAQHIQATLNWCDGEPSTRILSETIGTDEPERVKCLPQSFVETVCNELAAPGGGEFERELKKVVFSKVKTADRLKKRSLDDLVHFRTQELRKKADSLAIGLHDLSTERASLEERLDPSIRRGLQKRIDQVKEQIKSHEAAKPVEVKSPRAGSGDGAAPNADLAALAKVKAERDALAEEIKQEELVVSSEQLRAAVAKKLVDKLDNLRAEFNRRVEELAADAKELGLQTETLATLVVNIAVVQKVRDDALAKRNAARASIDAPAPNGLTAKRTFLEEQIKIAQDHLDQPQQEYQQYLERLEVWQATSEKLLGTPELPNSLRGLEVELRDLDEVPAKIDTIQKAQKRISHEIHSARVAEAAIYSELYGPVQNFISNHPLAKDHLKLEFKVELVEQGFVDELLCHLNQNRVGSFYGIDDGRISASKLAATVNWSDWDSLDAFLRNVVDHLHNDKRANFGGEVLLKSQIGKGKTAADLYAWLYGLAYIKPRYRLGWDGKDVGQLSPGERGTLLLIFYLLIDESDTPLIIDQPEANLDNITVANKLVDCIRDARNRRQVVIVTHNPNLAVVCDADQIIHAAMDKPAGNRVTYLSGGLEHPEINRLAINVLEGGRPPFDKRDDTYRVSGA